MNYYRIACIAVIFVVGSFIYFADEHFSFNYFSVCSQCATIQNTKDLQLPLIGVTYSTSHTIKTTPLSELLAKNKLIKEHQHQWIFASGSGNGVVCAIGSGRYLNQHAHSPMILSFLSHWLQRDKAKAKLWTKVILHPDSTYIDHMLPFYKDNITDDDFDRWYRTWRNKDNRYSSYLSMYPLEVQQLVNQAFDEEQDK